MLLATFTPINIIYYRQEGGREGNIYLFLFYFSLGEFLGKLTVALRDFSHPATVRGHLWDVTNILFLESFVDHIADPVKKDLALTVVRLSSVCLCLSPLLSSF